MGWEQSKVSPMITEECSNCQDVFQVTKCDGNPSSFVSGEEAIYKLQHFPHLHFKNLEKGVLDNVC